MIEIPEESLANQKSKLAEQENQVIPITQKEINEFIAALDDSEKFKNTGLTIAILFGTPICK